jgi:hypothetical protein
MEIQMSMSRIRKWKTERAQVYWRKEVEFCLPIKNRGNACTLLFLESKSICLDQRRESSLVFRPSSGSSERKIRIPPQRLVPDRYGSLVTYLSSPHISTNLLSLKKVKKNTRRADYNLRFFSSQEV